MSGITENLTCLKSGITETNLPKVRDQALKFWRFCSMHPAYLPDPLFDFSEGLVPRLIAKWGEGLRKQWGQGT